MPPRAKRRGRPAKRRTRTSSNGAAGALLSQVTDLVRANEALTAENRRLQSALSDIGATVNRFGGTSTVGRRRGRPPASASRAAGTNGRRRRRRVTNPETLERRRAGLAKARAVLAAKRAAAKRGRG